MAKRLGVNGRKKSAERKVKTKSFAKKIIGKLFVLLIIVGAAIITIIGGLKGYKLLATSIKDSKAFEVTSVNVIGNKHVDSKSILAKCGLNENSKTYLIKEGAVRTSLLSNPWIQDVKISKKMGGKIVVSVKERKPIALVNIKSVYYIDKNGILFPIAQNAISEMPVLFGLRDTMDSKGLRKIRSADMVMVKKFLHTLAVVDDRLIQSITQVDFTDSEKIKLSFQAYSTLVELDHSDLENGLRRLMKLENLFQGDTAMPEKINLCFHNFAFVSFTEDQEQKKSVQAVAD